jgi:glutathione S-transferase
MTVNPRPVLFHSPQTRSTGSLMLLKELGVPYDLNILNLKTGEQRREDYLKINPLGKVPALRHGDTVVTEQVAIFIYLADRFPQAGLAPAFDDPRRGAYLRWLVYYGSCFEPAAIDRTMKREPAPASTSPYGGNFDTVMNTIVSRLAQGPYLLGETLSAADLLWGYAFSWTTTFGIVDSNEIIDRYIRRITARQAYTEAMEQDAALAAEHDKATDS